ncbi:MAG: carboxypeptidase-like regulatory domain-containing protein, partial [Prolixibacteraceae bacterium]|nr:carboxypeptidase-like regulatory domain-containing protein [Prolixibacteraceae bacterium]
LTILLFTIVKAGLAFQPVALSGVVTNARDGETISDISIFVEDLKTGTITNQSGSYLLYLKEGSYKIIFSGKGFLKKEIEVELMEDHELSVVLTPDSKPKSKGRLKKE